MADKKGDAKADLTKRLEEQEQRLNTFVDKVNGELLVEMDGKPYLLILATLHEVDREGGKSRMAAQWNWRSNIDPREEDRPKKDVEVSRTLMKFLTERLNDVLDHPEGGIRKKYKLD